MRLLSGFAAFWGIIGRFFSTGTSRLFNLYCRFWRRIFPGFYKPENLSHSDGNLFYDASHGYCFHADFSSPNLHADGMFEPKLTNLREKAEHFLQTFRTLSQRGRTVFFYRTNEGP